MHHLCAECRATYVRWRDAPDYAAATGRPFDGGRDVAWRDHQAEQLHEIRVDCTTYHSLPRPVYDEVAAARHLANLPPGEIPAAVAALSTEDLGEVRDILGGAELGPAAGSAYEACTREEEARAEDIRRGPDVGGLDAVPDPMRGTPAVTAGGPGVATTAAAIADGPGGGPAETAQPILAAPPRYRPGSQDDLAPSGQIARIRANLAALTALRTIQAESRSATAAEQQVLARWSGWGAVPAVFDPGHEDLAWVREELSGLLDQAEMFAAARSTLNAHYTDAAYVAQIWAAVSELGFTGGRVLEPGCGSGNFIGFAPDGAHLTGVELDPVTSGIAAALYPGAGILNESFADTRIPDGYFDLAIGNVPFAPDRADRLNDPRHNPGRKHSIHNHFIIKSLHLTRPGGLVAVLTSRYTLDAEDPSARQDIAALADLVGAVRLPSRAHQRAAGTTAVTDLLILRRRGDGETPQPFEWEQTRPLHVDGADVPVNAWFLDHPEMVLGQMRAVHGPHRADDLNVRSDGDVAAALRQALQQITRQARDAGLTWTPAERPAAPEPRPAASASAEPDGYLRAKPEGTFTQVAGGLEAAFDVPATQAPELRQLLSLKETVRALLDAEAATADDTPELNQMRRQLNLRYDTYVRTYGPVNRFSRRPTGRVDRETGEKKYARIRPPMGGFRTDPFAPAVLALEEFDPVSQRAGKADIFTQRVVAPRSPRLSADDPADALAICVDVCGEVRLPVIGRLLGKTLGQARDALGTLVFEDPEAGKLVPSAEYLSGRVRAKLKIAEEAIKDDARFAVNVTALREVVPADLAPGQIVAQLGASWIGKSYVRQFLQELIDPGGSDTVQVEHPGGSLWTVTGPLHGVLATSTWGTGRYAAPDLAQAILEQRRIEVRDTITVIMPDGREGKRSIVNVDETLAAQEKAAEMAERFSEWVWEDPARAAQLAETFNEKLNGLVLRNYDDAQLSLPGLSLTFEPFTHQVSAVARIINEPAAGLFHEVGAGKTAEMAMGCMELRRLGLVRKPAIIVPNNILEQFAREFMQLYPQARILVTHKEDLRADKRREFIARIATGDWDAVIIAHSSFERIPLHADAQQAYTDRQLELIREWIERADEQGERHTVKRLHALLLSKEEKLKGKLSKAQDAGLTFEATGIDYVFVDEADLFKNLMTLSNIPGAGIEGSMRASDLDMKFDYLRARAGDRGRVLSLATATPVANSVTEAFVMQHYLRPDLLEDAGITDFDTWAATFGQTVTEIELAPEGGTSFRQNTRFARFRNIPELLRMMFVAADVKTAEDLKLPIPLIAQRPDGKRAPETVAVDPCDAQLEFIADLGRRAEAIRRGLVHKSEDNMLKVSGDGRAAALDMRLLGLAMDVPGKIGACADRVTAIWQAHRHDVYKGPDGQPHPVPGALQLVFCDLGTPSAGWNAYRELRDQLVARGMPSGVIQFIHDADTDQKTAELFDACRAGKVAVLVGSTFKMGAGTNVQDRAIALHHLDVPWRPRDVAQREGRILRQRNQNPEAHIIRYVTKRSFDAYMWQTLERKARFINQIMRGRLDVREIDDVGDVALSCNEVKALATDNPLLIDKAQADAELTRLERAERAHQRNQDYLQYAITRSTRRAQDLSDLLPRIDQAIAQRRDTRADAFVMNISGRSFRKRADAGEKLRDLLVRETAGVGPRSDRSRTISAGELGGFPVAATMGYAGFGKVDITIYLQGAPGTELALDNHELAKADPGGLVIKIENRLRGLEDVKTRTLADIDRQRAETAHATADVGKPFPRADELAATRARVREIDDAITALAKQAEQAARQEAEDADPAPAEPGHDGTTAPGSSPAAGSDTAAPPPGSSPATAEPTPAPAEPSHDGTTAPDTAPPSPATAHEPPAPADPADPAARDTTAAEPAPAPDPARPGAAVDQPPAGHLPDLAAEFGLHINDEQTLIWSDEAGPGGYALCREQPGGPLLNRSGRIIAASRAGTYLDEYAADPRAAPDTLYTRMAARFSSDTGPAPYEHAWPRGIPHRAVTDAATRASDTGQPYFIFADGKTYVTTGRPPGRAHFAVTPDGRWTRHVDDAVTAVDRPGGQQLSLIDGQDTVVPGAEGPAAEPAGDIGEDRGPPDTPGPGPGAGAAAAGGHARTTEPEGQARHVQRSPGTAGSAAATAGEDPAKRAARPRSAGDWTASHPFAAEIDAMRQAALADTHLALVAQANDEAHFALVFCDWPTDHVISGTDLDSGTPLPPFADAFFADPSLAAALTATLGGEVHAAHGDAARPRHAASGDAIWPEALRRAAKAWTNSIGQARSSQCGCDHGCRACAPPRDRDTDLDDAITIDTQLAQAGIPHARRKITWDDSAAAYAVEATSQNGDRVRLTIPPAGGEYTAKAGDTAPAVLPARRDVTPAAETARLLLSLAGHAEPGARPPDDRPGGISADDLRELAGRHGLTAEPGSGGVVFIQRDPGPASRYALRQEQPGLPLMNRYGRIIPAAYADAYLTAWTADPDASPDDLYAQAIPDPGSPPAEEHAYPRERCHVICSDASTRASDTGHDHYLYADGRAAVAAARPPVEAAYYSVSPSGQWTRHMNGTTEALEHTPDAQALSAIAGETSAAASAPATPPAQAGWTAAHPYAAQITAMRDAALANTQITASARNSDWQNFAITFTAWARKYLPVTGATAISAAAAVGTGPPDWALAFFDDHSLTADLAATLASQVRQQLTGTPAADDPGDEDLDEQAVATAATAWQQRAEKARTAAHDCPPGCDQCPLPAGPALRQATATDMHLARYGIPHTRRTVAWYEDDATWDVAVTDGARWHRLLADPGQGPGQGPGHVALNGTGGGQIPALAGEAARRARALIGVQAAGAPAAATSPAAQRTATEMTPEVLRELAGPAGEAAPAGKRMTAYQELAARHGLSAERGEYDEREIVIRSPHAPPGRFGLAQEGDGEPVLNENGRIIPVPRLDRYLAAYAADPDASPDQLYAQAAARSPDVAAAEHAFPLRRADLAIDDAAARARDTGTAHHLRRDGMAMVSTPHQPGTTAYYTVTPDGRWTGSPGPPVRGGPPTARQLRHLTGDPSQAAGPADTPRQAADAKPAPAADVTATGPPEPAGTAPGGPPSGPAEDSDTTTAIPRVTVLHGHTSPETAHVVDGYPYGRHTCKRRSWLETAVKGSARGQVRLVHQTTNPRRETEFWNKPNRSTYVHWAVMYLKPNGHLDWHAFGYWGPSGALNARIHLDGSYAQLEAPERAAYDEFANRARAHGVWEDWDKALAFIRAHTAEHGRPPTLDEVAAAPGFYLDKPDRETALIAARSLPGREPESPAGDTSPTPPAAATATTAKRVPAAPDGTPAVTTPAGEPGTPASSRPGRSEPADADQPSEPAGADPASRQPRLRPPRRPQPPRVVRTTSDLRQLASVYGLSMDTGPPGSGRAPLSAVHDHGRTVLLHDEISGVKAGGYRLDPGEVDAYLAAYTDHPGLPPRPLLDLARRDPGAPGHLTLTAAREIAARHSLEVRVRRIAGQSYITICEPGITGPPVLSYPAGAESGYHGPCAVPGPAADGYLFTYRLSVPASMLTAPAGAPGDWARRVAQLTPHLVEEGGHFIAGVRDHVRAALIAARNGSDADAARELDLAENLAPSLALTPDREAELAAAIGEHASQHGPAGDLHSYMTSAGQIDASGREHDWIRSHIAALPTPAEHQGTAAHDAAQPDADRRAAADKARQADTALGAGDYDQALTLLDQAELLSPGHAEDYAAARQLAVDARSARHDGEAVAPGGQAAPAPQETTSGRPGTAPPAPPAAAAANAVGQDTGAGTPAPGGAGDDRSSAGSDSQPGPSEPGEAAAAGLALLAEDLTSAPIGELPAPGPADSTAALAAPAAGSAADPATAPVARPEPAAIVITQCGDNTWEISVGGAAVGILGWVGGYDGTVDPTGNELTLLNADARRIASLYPSGVLLPAAITEGDYRVCLAGSGREIARHASLEDAVRETLAAAGDTADDAAPGAERPRAAPADGPGRPAPAVIVITDPGTGRRQIRLNGADAGYLSRSGDELQLFDTDGRHIATLYGPSRRAAAAGEPEYIFTYPADPQEEAGRASLEDALMAAFGASPDAARAAWRATMDAPPPAIPAEETLAARIKIDASRAKPVISGTDYDQDPPELRQALREHHFSWRKPQRHWEYKGPARERARHVAAIRETIARLDAEAAHAATQVPAAEFPPTPQQVAIIDAAAQGLNVAVQALAGTGKTTTLVLVARRLIEQDPAARIVYTAFNSDIVRAAQRGRFPRNVTAATMHPIAKRALTGTSYDAKIARVDQGARWPEQWAAVLGIPEQTVAGELPLTSEAMARLVMFAVKKFRESADDELGPQHLPPSVARSPQLASAVLRYGRAAWQDIADPGNAHLLGDDDQEPRALLVTHDDYLKVWALSHPQISATAIFFDEAQDVNDVMRRIILEQQAPVVVVGDSQQSIYGFRGCIDALRDWPADVVLPLTQSWRFGTEGARLGNRFLRSLSSPLMLEGNPAVITELGPVDDPDAILCRTNATAVGEVFNGLESGKRVALAGGGQAITDIAKAAAKLQHGRRTNHPELSRFSDWAEVQEFVRDGGDAPEARSLRVFVQLIDTHGTDALIDMVRRLTPANAKNPPQLTVTTVHKSKGLEFDTVRIADDFKGPKLDPATGEYVLPSREERRLAYVAVTRARKRLEIGSLSWINDYFPDDPSTALTAREGEEEVDEAQAIASAAEDNAAAGQVLTEGSSASGQQPAEPAAGTEGRGPVTGDAATAAAERPSPAEDGQPAPPAAQTPAPARQDEVVVNLATWAPSQQIPHGWLIVNAPRPVRGQIKWQGEFRHGLYWAAAPASQAGQFGWEDADAWPVRFVTDEQILAEVTRYLADNGYSSAEEAGVTVEEVARDLGLPWAGPAGREPADAADAPAAATAATAPSRGDDQPADAIAPLSGPQPPTAKTRPPGAPDGEIPEPGGGAMRFMNYAEIEEAACRWHDHPVLGPATRTLANLQAWTNTHSDGWPHWAPPVRAAARLINLIVRDGTARYHFDEERADATPGELRRAYTPIRSFRTKHNADFEIEDPGQADVLATAPPEAGQLFATSSSAPAPGAQPSSGAPAAAPPGADNADGHSRVAGEGDGAPQEAPQMLVLAAAPETEGLASAGAAGRPVREYLQGPVGQIWVSDHEGTIWAWRASGGALMVVAGAEGGAAGSPSENPPAVASPVPAHVRALAGRLIGRGGVTVRIDPPMSADYRDWTIAFVRGYGEEVWLTVPGDRPAGVSRATVHRFEISRGSRVSTGQDILPVTPGQPASDGQLAEWLQTASTRPAPAPLPGQPARPEETRPLAEDVPWRGPIHPDLPVYRDDTLLAIRCQGPDEDQTWHGTAAGIVPGDGPHEPGLLQVVAWETGTDGDTRRYSIVHPALTARLTDDPYEGLDPRQRERWQFFDQAAAAGRTTADLPASLVDPGDAVESRHPAAAATKVVAVTNVMTVQSVTATPDGETTVEGTDTDRAVALHYPPGQPVATRIPATRPSTARTGADGQTAAPAEDNKEQAPAGPEQPELDGEEPAATDGLVAAAEELAGPSHGPAGAQPPDGTQPLTSHEPWQGQRRPERLVYADGTPLTVRVPGPLEPSRALGGRRAAVAVGGRRAAGGGLMQVVRWEDGGYAVVHPALTWPVGTDPYPGLDERQRQRWEVFDAAEARQGGEDGDIAFLPSTLADPGDRIYHEVKGRQRDLVIDRLQPVAGNPPGHEIICTGLGRGISTSANSSLPVRIPATHPTLTAAITAIAGHPAAGAAAEPAPPHKHLPRHVTVADPHRYTQMVRGQRVTLERAIASGDRDQVVAACRDAVIRWNEPGNDWPEDADRWQDALDQFLPGGATDDERLLLEDLTVEPVPNEADSAAEEGTLFDVDELDADQPTERDRPGQAIRSPRPGPGAPGTTPTAGPQGQSATGTPSGWAVVAWSRQIHGSGPRHDWAVAAAQAMDEHGPDAELPPFPRPHQPGVDETRAETVRRIYRQAADRQGADPGQLDTGRRADGVDTGPAPITNSDVAAAWQDMAASSSGHAWSVAEFIAHGTVPDPGAVHGPDDPQDTTAWDGDGLRRTVASEQPGREGTLTWDQASRWINAGMTPGDLRILLEASRVIAYCDGWLDHLRDTTDEDQTDAFYDAGRGAAVALQECVSRVTAAAAQAHGPHAAVPADPAGTDSYRREPVVTTPGQGHALAAIRELRGFAQQAAQRINGSNRPGPAAIPASAPASAAAEAAGQGALALAAGAGGRPATTGETGRGQGGRDDSDARRPGDPASVAEAVSDDEIRAAFETFRNTAAGDRPAADKDRALAGAFRLAMLRDEATHQHPAADTGGDRYAVTYCGPFGTDTTLPACCEQSARQSAQAMSRMMAAPVSAVTITGEDGRHGQAVFRGGQPVAPAAAPAAELPAAGEPHATAGLPTLGREDETAATPAGGPQPRPGSHQAVCTGCNGPLDPALQGIGYSTHPNCDPAEQPGDPASEAALPALALDSGSHAQPAVPGTELSGAERRGRDELHAAVDFLAAQPGPAATVVGPGFADTDAYLGMFLADVPAGQWTDQMAIAAWAMLGRYAGQLGEAGVSYDRLLCPPGAEHMNGAQLAAVQQTATQQVADIWPGMLRGRHGPRYIRCDTHGAPVILGYDSLTDTGLLREAAQIAGLHGYATAAQVGMFSFASLPDVVALAERHDIPVTDHVRALAAAASRQASITAGPGPASSRQPDPAGAADPDEDATGQQPPVRADATPGPQPVTGSDLALALRRMAPERFAALIESGRDPAWHQLDGSRHDSEPDPGASELIEFDRAGVRIRVGAADGARDRTLTWPQIRHWIQPGLTPARQQLLATAVRTRLRYSMLASGYAVPGTPAHEGLQQATCELDGIQQRVIDAIISTALARRGAGPLPHRLTRPAGQPGDNDEALPLPADGSPAVAETAGLERVAELASVLPDWPPRWSAPVSQVRAGDVLRGPAHSPALLVVTAPPRRTGTVTELAGTAGGPDGPDTTWRISHDRDPDPEVEVVPAGGPLTGPIPAPGTASAPATAAVPGPSRPVPALPAADGTTSQDRQGQPALPPGTGPHAGSGQATTAALPRAAAASIHTEPAPESPMPGHADDPRPAAAGAPASQEPVLGQGPPGPAPEGIIPLRESAAASRNRYRPTRLVYPDGTPLTCRPNGRFGPAWTGTAAGVKAASSEAGGWLQRVLDSDGRVHDMHPAVIAPTGINPYALMGYRDQKRFSDFDQAEAAGRDAALISPALVDVGDLVRAQAQPGGGDPQIRYVTAVTTAGIHVQITTTGPGEDTRTDPPYLIGDRIEVMLPSRHPAEDGPYAGRLFSPQSHQTLPGQGADDSLSAALAATASPAAGTDASPIAVLESRVAQLERELALLRAAGTPGPQGAGGGPARDAEVPGWGPPAASAESLRQAQATSAQSIPGLGQDWLWTQLRDLTDSACRFTRDALTGRLRFANLPQALRSWRGLWEQVCELTGDLADAMMARLRPDSLSWRAARGLRRAAAEGVAHARGWLFRREELPPENYDPPPSLRAPTWALADAATRLHREDAGPLSQIADFPGALAGAPARKTPGPRARDRAARTRAARTRRHAGRPVPRP